jgi:hypothetical protein
MNFFLVWINVLWQQVAGFSMARTSGILVKYWGGQKFHCSSFHSMLPFSGMQP